MSETKIIGHQKQLASLEADVKAGNIAHAYLFAGPAHIGKFTVAKWFAKKLLLDDVPDAQKDEISHKIDRLLHPDLLVLDLLWREEISDDMDEIAKHSNVPQQHRAKAHAKTDTIGIDDIRVLQERLQETGTGRYRFALIRSVERMQDEAVNALLKILEEPPEGVIFLLTTEHEHQLLPTLISRSRVVHFSRVPLREMDTLLKGIKEEDQEILTYIAHGAPGLLKRLRDDPDLLREEQTLMSTAVNFWKGSSPGERFKLLAPLLERTPESDRLLFHLALALRRQAGSLNISHAKSLAELADVLDTNVSRPIAVQRFALCV
jgi:DNA polymerase-3 subunit delta'